MNQSECTACRLHKARSRVVVSDGPVDRNCDIVIVGEAPGKDEDKSGIPFVGRSGRFLRKACKRYGSVDLGIDCVVLSSVSCRPPNNRNPLEDELEACAEWLQLNMFKINPKYVLLVGKWAAKSFLQSVHILDIGRLLSREKLLDMWNNDRFRFRPYHIYHPSYVERQHSIELRHEWNHQIAIFFAIANGRLDSDANL